MQHLNRKTHRHGCLQPADLLPSVTRTMTMLFRNVAFFITLFRGKTHTHTHTHTHIYRAFRFQPIAEDPANTKCVSFGMIPIFQTWSLTPVSSRNGFVSQIFQLHSQQNGLRMGCWTKLVALGVIGRFSKPYVSSSSLHVFLYKPATVPKGFSLRYGVYYGTSLCLLECSKNV